MCVLLCEQKSSCQDAHVVMALLRKTYSQALKPNPLAANEEL